MAVTSCHVFRPPFSPPSSVQTDPNLRLILQNPPNTKSLTHLNLDKFVVVFIAAVSCSNSDARLSRHGNKYCTVVRTFTRLFVCYSRVNWLKLSRRDAAADRLLSAFATTAAVKRANLRACNYFFPLIFANLDLQSCTTLAQSPSFGYGRFFFSKIIPRSRAACNNESIIVRIEVAAIIIIVKHASNVRINYGLNIFKL
jgi:hypothetical protein